MCMHPFIFLTLDARAGQKGPPSGISATPLPTRRGGTLAANLSLPSDQRSPEVPSDIVGTAAVPRRAQLGLRKAWGPFLPQIPSEPVQGACSWKSREDRGHVWATQHPTRAVTQWALRKTCALQGAGSAVGSKSLPRGPPTRKRAGPTAGAGLQGQGEPRRHCLQDAVGRV